MKSTIYSTVALVLCALTVSADWRASHPIWWRSENVVDYTLDPQNMSPINQGQLLFLVQQALEELDRDLMHIGGAGFTLLDFYDEQTPDYFAPVNQGQLKNVSHKFYQLFERIGFTGSAYWPVSIVLNEGPYDLSPDYPWLNDVEGNFSPALIGQAKHLFSWELREYTSIDSENDGVGDGLPDWWEHYWFGNLITADGANTNSDGDDFNDYLEYLYHENPVDPLDQSRGSIQLGFYSLPHWNFSSTVIHDMDELSESQSVASVFPVAFTSPGFSAADTAGSRDFRVGEIYRGTVEAPYTGVVEFYLSSNRHSRFYIADAPDVSVPTEEVLRGYETSEWYTPPLWAGPYSVEMIAGEDYELKAMCVNDTTDGYFQIGWKFEDMADIEIIPGKFLKPYNRRDYQGLSSAVVLQPTVGEVIYETELLPGLNGFYSFDDDYHVYEAIDVDLHPPLYTETHVLNERLSEVPRFLNTVSEFKVTTYRESVGDGYVYRKNGMIAVPYDFVVGELPAGGVGYSLAFTYFLSADYSDNDNDTYACIGVHPEWLSDVSRVGIPQRGYPGGINYLDRVVSGDPDTNPEQERFSGWRQRQLDLGVLAPGAYRVYIFMRVDDTRNVYYDRVPLESKLWLSDVHLLTEYEAPVADVVSGSSVYFLDEIVTFDGSNSIGQDLQYTWSIDSDIHSHESVFECAFTEPGSYSIQLTVVDEWGHGDTVVNEIEVCHTPTLVLPDSLYVGEQQTLGLLNADCAASPVLWEFGDGGTDVGGTVSHTYSSPGAVTVTALIAERELSETARVQLTSARS